MSSALVKRADRFVETEIDGETVVMELESGDFFSLSGSALSIWQMIDGTRDKPSLVAAVAAEYRVAEAELAPEIDAFVADLKAAKLVEGG
ncbi:PqqD family protein [Novosphingobium sp.]|uniref:PqqD family protein n=1 Tax=Novosphingobium sp. TaxID=1874826 RepID=UPI0025D56797|nr:PqqD family protein [Novosphingobium sp.]